MWVKAGIADNGKATYPVAWYEDLYLHNTMQAI